MAPSYSKFDDRNCVHNFAAFCGLHKWRFGDWPDAFLDPAVQALLTTCSFITSKLPRWFQRWFDFAIFSVFQSRPLKTTLPLFVVGTIIGVLYVGFVNVYLPLAGYALLSPRSISFHALLVLAVASYYKGVVTDPGEVPDSWATLPHGATASKLVEKKKSSGQYRWCQKEKKYKPDRAHYCTPMNRNVLRMDHYCPWLSTCIGYHNHKYFFLFLLYTTIATNIVGLSLGSLLWSPTLLSAGHTFFAWEVEGLAALLSVVITPFFGFHCFLASRNMTTIEFCEKMRDKTEARSPYDVNFYHNIKSILGTNPFTWLLPVSTALEGDGLTFDLSPEWIADASADPEMTPQTLPKSCWKEMFDDMHRACNDCHDVTMDAASRFYKLVAGIK